jgi:hypothetical protein
MAAALEKEVVKGGGFLLTETLPASVFSPEDFSDEQQMIAQTTQEFMEKEVIPQQRQDRNQGLRNPAQPD